MNKDWEEGRLVTPGATFIIKETPHKCSICNKEFKNGEVMVLMQNINNKGKGTQATHHKECELDSLNIKDTKDD